MNKTNKTKRVLVALGSVFCLVLLGSNAFSQGLSEQYPPITLSDVTNIGGEVLAIPYSSVTKVGPNTWGFNPGSMEVGLAAGAGYLYQDPYVYALTYYPP